MIIWFRYLIGYQKSCSFNWHWWKLLLSWYPDIPFLSSGWVFFFLDRKTFVYMLVTYSTWYQQTLEAKARN